MYLSLFDIIILFGALQGLILGLVLLFSKPEERISGKKNYLALLVLILVYNGLETFSWSSDNNTFNYFFSLFPNVLIFGLGPCLYLYIRSFTHPQGFSKSTLLKHFAIVGVQFALRLFILAVALLNQRGTVLGLWSADLDILHNTVSDNLAVVVFWFYLVLAGREIWLQYKNPEEQIPLKWLRILYLFTLVWGIAWAVTTVYPVIFKANKSSYYYPIEVLQVLFIYWLGITGFYRIKVVQVEAQKKTGAYFEGIDTETVERCEVALKKAMETERLYLDPELTVSKLADHINISAKTISAVLNQHLQKGFSEYVNDYRIAEVKRRLARNETRTMTIAGIALDSGFNSMATFQRVFKSSENMTPKEYLAKVSENKSQEA
ncbi:helix-turn-helix domain-containing protein [Pontibacter cellulosilyticus]|uniref:Helix-turn-helix transcriptional regulator n=1 Tax=Pontibacter cellulosilyticus TaxID=1720253 RepID=A0A923N6Q1_9BACT|nr:helix-turn-helix domain-containing protein [Pontibacter cellulosilyticus]MBC5992446.1 helix-turn-helix transcriptional regulator [Pontibacter cellulosilyticus]